MYTNILIPTDGSELAGKAVQPGIALAKRIGAKATVRTVLPPFHVFTTDTQMLEETPFPIGWGVGCSKPSEADARSELPALTWPGRHSNVRGSSESDSEMLGSPEGKSENLGAGHEAEVSRPPRD